MEMLCEVMSKKYFPVIRKMLAEILIYEKGYTQQEVGEILGITQSAVSLYLKESRGKSKKIKLSSSLKKEIRSMANTLPLQPLEERKYYLCHFCKIIRKEIDSLKIIIPKHCS